MIVAIRNASKYDTGLARLLDEAHEYACVYVLARQRQKGCDGMGELATMKEEFRDVVDKVIKYCQEKKYISHDLSYDIDSIADEIVKGRETL
jgi:SOS response regulatory protein OraA/RecX